MKSTLVPYAHDAGCNAAVCYIGASKALLRELSAELHIPNAAVFWTDDFRRSHAQDLRRGGPRLYEILAAGDWKSVSFLAYLDRVGLERDQVIEAQTGFNDSDEEAHGLRDSGDQVLGGTVPPSLHA